MDMEEKEAQLAADRYNSASRTYDKFDIIIKNLSEFPKIDIRDLSIVELRLAVNMEWVRLRSASIHLNGKKREANEDIGQPQKQVNWGKVYQHADGVRKQIGPFFHGCHHGQVRYPCGKAFTICSKTSKTCRGKLEQQ